MAAKHIPIDFVTGKTLYCIIRREADSYLLNDAAGSFASSPADMYLSLAGHYRHQEVRDGPM